MATCGGGYGHSGHNTGNQDDSLLCLAVIRENGADVVLFDATGVPRSFKYTGDTGKLCFSTHGNGHVDDLLTPCFDEDGKHGLPEESCFCGVDTPHLHAHLHDPKTCNEENEANSKKTVQGESDLSRLAQLTLHPTDDEEEPLINLSVSEQLPNECNSKDFARHMSERGLESSSRRGRRMHKIQHDDHVDYLVHDETTGDLHLEHPCDDCGDNDVHGKFHLVGMRRLQGGDEQLHIHFFEVAPKKFHILDHIAGLFDFDLSSDRVLAARPAHDYGHANEHPTPSSPKRKKPCCEDGVCTLATHDDTEFAMDAGDGKTVRSTFFCSRICCASEIPMINEVLEPVPGVEKVLINVPVKMVTVDHDPEFVSAKDIEAILNKNHFGAQLKTDGAANLATGSTTGRSQFYVQKICCASEIPAINSIVEPMDGVSKVSINVTNKMVYVDHDTAVVTATEICDAMNEDCFGAHIRHDAADDVRVPLSAFVRSTLSFELEEELSPDTETLKEFLGSFDTTQMESFVVDMPSEKINVVHNAYILSAEAIVEELAHVTGIKATIVVNGAETTNWDFPEVDEDTEDAVMDSVPRPSIPTILSGIFWVISMLSLIGGNWEYLKYVALVSVAFGLPPIALKAFRTLRRCQFDTNVLMFSAVVGALALEEFTEAAAVTFLFSISEWLEVRATSRARNALSEIVRLRPDKANLIHPFTKEVTVVPATSVPVGALVSVRPGDKIPCDGVVVEGESTVDESSLTGESRPVRKCPKDAVSGGTINSGNTELVVRTTTTSENSAVARLIRLVEEAQANRSPTEKLVDAFAKKYTPIVLLAAICMCTIPWAFGRDVGREWTHNGLVLIVVACPCALIISTPVTYVAGLAATAQKGCLIKGGAHLEALGQVKKIAFDKTGTLTKGEFALLHLNTFSNLYSREEVLQYLTVMEERASHPLAQAIVHAAQNENVTIPKGMVAKNHTQIPGEGVTAIINGKSVYVGNERLFRSLGLFQGLPLEQKQAAEEWASLGGTIGFMGIEECGIVCAYCVADAIRPESAQVVSTLTNDFGIDVTMLTGDNHTAATAIGQQIGLSAEHIRSQLLPEDKLAIVSELKEDRRSSSSVCANPCRPNDLVLMCGDGVNDAPALAIADVGVAMGAGAALAMETSDVTLLDSQLDKLVYCIRMGHRVIRKIRENVIFSIVVKAIVVGFAIAGSAHLWAAIAADVGAMLIVTLNGMTLLPFRKSKKQTLKDGDGSDADGESDDSENFPLQNTSGWDERGHSREMKSRSHVEVDPGDAPCCDGGECRSRKMENQCNEEKKDVDHHRDNAPVANASSCCEGGMCHGRKLKSSPCSSLESSENVCKTAKKASCCERGDCEESSS